MTTMLEYKGYLGSVDFSDEDEVFHGRLEFIRDLVTYEATDARSLKQTFHEAVDDHLALCAEQGRTPDEPLKGSFNVRPGPDLHRRAMLFARRRGLNLNTVVSDALREYLDQKDRVVHGWGHVHTAGVRSRMATFRLPALSFTAIARPLRIEFPGAVYHV